MDELSISPEELAKIIGQDEAFADSEDDAATQFPRDDLSQLSQSLKSPAAAPSFPMPSDSQLVEPTPRVSRAGEDSRPVAVSPAEFAPLVADSVGSSATNLDLLMGVTMRVTVELGRTKMTIEEILELGPGAVIELDKLAGEPVDVLINDRLIAKGEVVVIDDRFGVRITDVIPPAQRVNSFR